MELEKYVHQLSEHPDFTYIHAKCDNWWRDPFYGVEESAMYYMMLVLLYDNLRGVLTAIAVGKVTVRANKRMAWTLDGEREPGHAEVEVKNLHHAIRLMQKVDHNA